MHEAGRGEATKYGGPLHEALTEDGARHGTAGTAREEQDAAMLLRRPIQVSLQGARSKESAQRHRAGESCGSSSSLVVRACPLRTRGETPATLCCLVQPGRIIALKTRMSGPASMCTWASFTYEAASGTRLLTILLTNRGRARGRYARLRESVHPTEPAIV